MQQAARWAVMGPLLAIPFLVLFVSNDLFFPFITGKGFAFRILVEIAFAGWVVLALADARYRPKFSWILALLGGFVVWMVLANALAVSPEKAFWGNFERMEGWITLVHVFALFVVSGSFFWVEGKWRVWWLTFLAASALVSAYSLIQLMCAGSLCGAPNHFFQIHQGGARVDGTLGNAIYLAQYLIFAIGVALWQGIESKGGLRVALFVLAAVHAVVLFFTATRGSILAVFIAAVAGTLWYAYEAGGKAKQAALAVFVALLVLGTALFTVRNADWVQHEPTLARLVSVFSASEWQTRGTIWHMALQGFAEHPVFGWGQEGFNYVFNEHYLPSMFGQEQWFDRAHNLYLDWLIAGGLPAMLLLIAFLVAGALALYRSAPKSARVILVAVLAAYAIQALAAFDNLFTYVPLAMLLGYAHSLRNRPIKAIEKISIPPEAVNTLIAPIAAVALAFVVWIVNVPGIAAAHELIFAMTPAQDPAQNAASFSKAASHGFASQEIAEQAVLYAARVAGEQDLPVQSRAQLVDTAGALIEGQIQDRPQDARIYAQAGYLYRAIGDYPDAEARLARALELTPNKQQIILDLGTNAWQQGDLKKARQYFDQAYALTPEADAIAVYEAVGRVLTDDGADAFLEDRFGTTTVDSDLLLYAYVGTKQYDRVIAILTARAQTDDYSITTGFQLASAYALAGRMQDARAAIDETVRRHPEARETGDALYSELQKS